MLRLSLTILFSLLISACGSGEKCEPEAGTTCRGGELFWVDSCGEVGYRIKVCDCGCNQDSSACEFPCPECSQTSDCISSHGPNYFCDLVSYQCVCAPACTGKCCGDDGCAGQCSDNCGPGTVCNPDTCDCEAGGPCVDGQAKCEGAVIEVCENEAWQPDVDCAETNQDCLDGQCVCAPTGDETCNGLDDDCDGQTDEDIAQRDCQLQAGVCQGALQACNPGVGWEACEYGPTYQVDETLCDGLDNDCDGETDEGLLRLEPESGAEALDGVDNNCNGLVDEFGGVMVPVPGHDNLWVDAFEMTVFENPDCTGQRYGEESDDYPAGWPASGAAQVEVYACSLAGLVPSGHLSWWRAMRACEAQGKRMCEYEQYRAACNGHNNNLYPYANVFVPGVCNDPLGGLGQVAPTGVYDQCTALGTTFDMSGNLAEWLDIEIIDYPGYYAVAGYGYACDLFYLGALDSSCDPDNPTPEQRDLVEAVSQCTVFDLIGVNYYVYRAFEPDTVEPFFGGRCCYDGW